MTDARQRASFDPRNAFTLLAAASVFESLVPLPYWFNIDATTYICSPSVSRTSGLKVWISHAELKGEPVKTNVDNPMNKVIKYYCISNADGMKAPIILVLKDDDFPDGEFSADLVNGLNPTQGVTEMGGWLVIMNDRSGNAAFFTWLYETFL
jgi:hypothetical protein